MEKLQLKDKNVLITGADSGIGKAIALLFAKEGANISFIHYHDKKDAEETKNEISALGRKALSFEGDINDAGFCKNAVEKTVSELGGIDILINNAGTQVPCENIEDLEEENIRKPSIPTLSE